LPGALSTRAPRPVDAPNLLHRPAPERRDSRAVTYVVFTGTGAVASPIEDHNAAATLDDQLAAQLLQNN
jgi:hypothetical protein